jgi:S1-C subfamily serine protease
MPNDFKSVTCVINMQNNRNLSLAISIVIVTSLGCSLSGLIPALNEPTSVPTTPLPAQPPPEIRLPAPVIENFGPIMDGDLTSLYNNISPGVVTIWAYSDLGSPHDESIPTGQGSGFVIDKQGHIVTNQHVIQDAKNIEVDLPTGIKSWATLLGTDPDSDLAVLKVDIPEDFLIPLPLGDSDLVSVGQFVVAIGNPFGLSGTMTVGIVSAIGRTLDSERRAPGGGSFSAGDLIQTDAAINPGNSGGPLLNLNGQVVGINRAIQTEAFSAEGGAVNSGVGFAIPVNILRRVAPSLIENGKYDYPYLGISSLNESFWNLKTLEALGFNSNASGAYITEVVRNGPADQAGLRGGQSESVIPGLLAGGDLIIAIDGYSVDRYDDLISYLFKNIEVGQIVTITVLRENEELNLELTTGARP